MRRLTLVVVALGFGMLIMAVSVVASTQAIKEEVGEATGSGEVKVVAENELKVDYYLPYPGILPDHPLYFVKMIRDRLQLWVTMDPVGKFERLLLYADKRIGAAEVLAKGNQPEMAVATATKAEKYLESAVKQAEGLGEEKKERLQQRLKNGYLTHLRILGEIEEKVPPAGKPTINEAIGLTGRGLKRVEEWVSEGVFVEQKQQEDLPATAPAELKKVN